MCYFNSTAPISRQLVQKTAVSHPSARNFLTFARRFSHKPSHQASLSNLAIDRTVFIFRQTVSYESIQTMRHVENVMRVFKQLNSSVRIVNKKDLEKELLTPQNSVLVATGEQKTDPMHELYDISARLREAIFKGHMNYYGVGAGAIFAGRGYTDDGLEIHISKFLRVANIMAAQLPFDKLSRSLYDGSKKKVKVIDQEGKSFLVHNSSGPSLQVLTYDNYKKEEEHIKKTAEYTDDSYCTELGGAVMKGQYGKGKIFLETYTGPDQIDKLSRELELLNLKKGALYVLEQSPYSAVLKTLEAVEKI